MSGWIDHLTVLPVVAPLVAAAVLLPIDERRHRLKAAVSIATVAVCLAVAMILFRQATATDDLAVHRTVVYLLGDWPAPFGIVLVLDRLSALMLVLTSTLAIATLVFSLANWDRAGSHFHSLFLFLVMGLNGAFLTGDLFNLFVFFEILLAASYGLVLHGSGRARVRTGLHYIAVNLVASSLFLIGVSMIYGVLGTLNMADVALRVPALTNGDRMLFESGAAILGVAFLVKAGMWPLGFWLPGAYSAAAPPIAAFFAIMTKVGFYIVLRFSLLMFGSDAGGLAHFGSSLLIAGGMMTVIYGSIGILAAQNLARLASYSIVISAGTLLTTVGIGSIALTGGALFYLVSSTLSIAALFMLTELAERGRTVGADVLAVTMEMYGESDDDEDEDGPEEVGLAIPGTRAVLGLCFTACALLIAGLPPLSGFVAKFLILRGLFEPGYGGNGGGVPGGVSWAFMGLLLLSGFAAVIAMMRAGIRVFWLPLEGAVPRVRLVEIAPIVGLLLLCIGLTLEADPVMNYTEQTAKSLHAPDDYIGSVMPSDPFATREATP
jgi:multicomponent K+:H+ antiporter subunit D